MGVGGIAGCECWVRGRLSTLPRGGCSGNRGKDKVGEEDTGGTENSLSADSRRRELRILGDPGVSLHNRRAGQTAAGAGEFKGPQGTYTLTQTSYRKLSNKTERSDIVQSFSSHSQPTQDQLLQAGAVQGPDTAQTLSGDRVRVQ